MEQYIAVLNDAQHKLKLGILSDINSPDFEWEQLINLILEEDSPLQEIFSEKTLQLADLRQVASRLCESASHLSDIENSVSNGGE